MSSATAEKRIHLPQANGDLQDWVKQSLQLREQLQQYVEGSGHSHLRGLMQWFGGIPTGASITVTPHEGVELEGTFYRGNMGYSKSSSTYDSETPFSGGAALRAEFEDASHDGQAAVGLRFVALHHDPHGGMNYAASAAIVPSELLPDQVDMAVVNQAPLRDQ